MKVYFSLISKTTPLIYLPDQATITEEDGNFYYNATRAAIDAASQKNGREIRVDSTLMHAVIDAGEAYWKGWNSTGLPPPSKKFREAASLLFKSLDIETVRG